MSAQDKEEPIDEIVPSLALGAIYIYASFFFVEKLGDGPTWLALHPSHQ